MASARGAFAAWMKQTSTATTTTTTPTQTPKAPLVNSEPPSRTETQHASILTSGAATFPASALALSDPSIHTSSVPSSSTLSASAARPAAAPRNRWHEANYNKKFNFAPKITNLSYQAKASIASLHGPEGVRALQQEVLREKLTHADGERRGPIRYFRGVLANSKDCLYPREYSLSKTKGMLRLSEYYDDDRAITPDRLLLSPLDGGKVVVQGYFPCISTDVIYDLRLQEQYWARNKGFQWSIINANVQPRLTDRHVSSLVRMIAYKVAALEPTIQDEPVVNGVLSIPQRKAVEKSICASIKKYKARQWDTEVAHNEEFEKNRFDELVETLTYGSDHLKALFVHYERPFYSLFPRISKTYYGDTIFKENPWWNDLSANFRAAWERKLGSIDSTYKLCFYSTMPDEFMFSGKQKSREYLIIANHIGKLTRLETQTIARIAKRERKNRSCIKLRQNLQSYRFAKKTYQLKQYLIILRIMELGWSQKTNTPQTLAFSKQHKHAMFPEITAKNFNYLCILNRWVSCRTSTRADDRQVMEKQQRASLPLVEIPDLIERKDSLAVYGWMTRSIVEHQTCSIRAQDVPSDFQRGMDCLCKHRVVQKVTETLDNGVTCSYYMLRIMYMTKRLFSEILLGAVLKDPPPADTDADSGSDEEVVSHGDRAAPSVFASLSEERKAQLSPDHLAYYEHIRKHPISVLTGMAGTGENGNASLYK